MIYELKRSVIRISIPTTKMERIVVIDVIIIRIEFNLDAK